MHSEKRYQRSQTQKAILATLLYSDIFSFPLTKDELWKYLISEKLIRYGAFEHALGQLILEKIITNKNGMYSLMGKSAIIDQRKNNYPYVEKKYKQAEKMSRVLSRIPSVLFIGLSGSLAIKDANESDDIDFFIIVKKDTVYMSRLLILLILELRGYRRKRGQRYAPDKICVNLLIDESALTWSKKQQDIYTAHEMAQMQPLYNKDALLERLYDANRWVAKYLPNAIPNTSFPPKASFQKSGIIHALFEKTARFIQTSYMKPHVTTEAVTRHYLAFHPTNYRIAIMGKFRGKMRDAGLLTKI